MRHAFGFGVALASDHFLAFCGLKHCAQALAYGSDSAFDGIAV